MVRTYVPDPNVIAHYKDDVKRLPFQRKILPMVLGEQQQPQ